MITFKEIEMSGFKSFADTTKINFDGGITAIVGPNGCGKSNVSDAIRWVFGEQSSKALRGKTMQDVIFSGTEKRRKLSYCEVTLVFDNSLKWFNVDLEEIAITRKLYRSGESEYFINKKPCRLKDIRDVLYDSGMGKDGYSIIGQGRVEEIISSKPEDRRAIFEEAAGIAKYKAKKTETENRLIKVRENLSRAGDIANEIERILGPLKKQSEDAKKYLSLRDELKQNEIDAYVYQYDHTSQDKAEIAVKMQGYQDNLKIQESSLETEQAKYDKSINEVNNLDQKANALHEQVLQKTVALEKQQGDFKLLNEQSRYLAEQIDRLKAQQSAYSLDINQKMAIVNTATQAKLDEQRNLQVLHNELQDLSNKYISIIDDIAKNEGEKEESQRAYIDNLAKLTDIKANLSAYIAKRDTMQENIKADTEKLNQVERQHQELQAEQKQLANEVNSLLSQKQQADSQVNKINDRLNALNELQQGVSERIYALKSSISNDTNRKAILTNLQADYEGYAYAVKRLMQDGKTNNQLKSAIKGVVANVIQVDEKYQTAIEIALGGSLQNIITANENDAKLLISYLKDTKSGRATFLPITSVKPRYLSGQDKQYLSSIGCLGVASSLIKTEPQYQIIMESLLGNTVICDTYDNAVLLAKKAGYSFKIVTLEGDVLATQGSITGGSQKSKDASLLSKESEIKQLAQNIEEKSKELQTLEQKNTEYSNEVATLKSNLNQLTEKYQNINNSYYSKNTRLESISTQIDELGEQIFSYQSQIKVATNIVNELTSQIDSIDDVQLQLDATKQNNPTLEDKDAYEQMNNKREEYSQNVTLTKVKIASTEEKIKSLERDIQTYTLDINSVKQALEKVNVELASQQRVYDEAERLNQAKLQASGSTELQQELDDLKIKLSQFDDFKKSLMAELKEIDEKKTALSNEIAKLNNKLTLEETKLQKIDSDLEAMQERLYNEYELTYNDCLGLKSNREDFDIKQTMTDINRIKNQITALGYVNVGAIEQYKSEGERYEELNAQILDLKKAEEDEVNIIQDLSKEMLEKFNTEFTKIQENFTKVFKELFGGGNARLELLPNEDPLSAGVEIIAQPPGKMLSNITLLSGGEKTMTAIAILFAILKLRPMPFCFLDEIEAALDDSNIDRYANYLKHFSNETQFIVITHRKPTMEVVDSLYGVTMEEKGVSKIVSVRLQDAIKVSSEETGKNKT